AVERRGLCGDVYLASMPSAVRINDVRVNTSVRKGDVTVSAAVENPTADVSYALRVKVRKDQRAVREFTSKPFKLSDLRGGRIAVIEKWKPDKLWDIHTPENMWTADVALEGTG